MSIPDNKAIRSQGFLYNFNPFNHFDDSMTQDIWRLVTPQYDDFNEPLAQFAQLTAVPFFDTQPRLLQAIERFIHIQGFSRVLLINAPDNSIYRCLIQEHLENTHRVPVVRTETLDMTMLFGQVTAKNGQVIDQTHGLLAQADNGYLIISANLLLANPLCWPMLKAAVLGEPVSPINVSKNRCCRPLSINLITLN